MIAPCINCLRVVEELRDLPTTASDGADRIAIAPDQSAGGC
jgi:hypothetical protein